MVGIGAVARKIDGSLRNPVPITESSPAGAGVLANAGTIRCRGVGRVRQHVGSYGPRHPMTAAVLWLA